MITKMDRADAGLICARYAVLYTHITHAYQVILIHINECMNIIQCTGIGDLDYSSFHRMNRTSFPLPPKSVFSILLGELLALFK